MDPRNRKRIGCLAVIAAVITFVDIASDDKKVGHIHNVTSLDLPESREVNEAMVTFLKKY